MVETRLPECFHGDDRDRIRQIERASFFDHGDADAVLFMLQKKLFRKPLRLFPKYKDIILRIRNIRIRLDRLGGIVVE